MSTQSDKKLTAFFIQEARRHSRGYLVAFALMPVTGVLAAYGPKVFQLAIDNGMLRQDAAYLAKMSFVFFAILALRILITPIQLLVLQYAGLRTLRSIRSKIVSRICRLGKGDFEKRPVGVFVSRATSDVEAIGETLATGLMSIISDIVTIAIILVVLAMQNAQLAALTFVLVPLIVAIINWFRVRLRPLHLRIRTLTGTMSGQLNETAMMRSEILNFHLGPGATEEFAAKNRKHRKASITSVSYDSSIYSIIDGLNHTVVGGVLVLVGLAWLIEDALTPGELAMYIALLQQIFMPFKQLGERIATIQATYAALEKINDVMDIPLPVDTGTIVPPVSNIEFRRVSFAYNPDTPVLKGISFSVPDAGSLAIVGPTGSGKSTIVRLLTRQYEIGDGDIRIGDVPIQDVSRETLRHTIVLVPQEPTIFNGTIAENVGLLRPEVDAATIQQSCRDVTAERFIKRLPRGYDTMLDNAGENLSMGQRQLIALARALATDAKVLLFDESTANIDTETELMIQEALDFVMKRKSTIIIAHRLSTIRDVDHIIVLNHGQVVEEGDHSTLLRRSGIYRQMYELQAKTRSG